jgi:hypothetical protein
LKKRLRIILELGFIEYREDIQKLFDQIFGLLPEPVRPEARNSFKTYRETKNILYLVHEIRSWKLHRVNNRRKTGIIPRFLSLDTIWKTSLICEFIEVTVT